MKHNGIIAIVFIVGCATGGVVAQLVVPPVRAGTSPTRWEYQCAEAGFIPDGTLAANLNKLGAEGWELVSMELLGLNRMHVVCAKRPLP